MSVYVLYFSMNTSRVQGARRAPWSGSAAVSGPLYTEPDVSTKTRRGKVEGCGQATS